MGGRGSSSGGGGGGFKAPTLTGSEKQVAWATDILRSPYDTMAARAKSYEKQANSFDKMKKGNGDLERQEAAVYKAAQKRYAAGDADIQPLSQALAGCILAATRHDSIPLYFLERRG